MYFIPGRKQNRRRLFFTLILSIVWGSSGAISSPILSEQNTNEEKSSQITSRELTGKTDENVILITLDGVRWQEVFQPVLNGYSDFSPRSPKNHFEQFWKRVNENGIFYGLPPEKSCFEVGSFSNMSLPAYLSIFTGKKNYCLSNYCDRTAIRTFPEKIRDQLGIGPLDVASVASWEKIERAVSASNSFFTNVGFTNMPVPWHFSSSSILDSLKAWLPLDNRLDWLDYLNKTQHVVVPPWPSARYDFFTYNLGIDYIKSQQPRFFYLSLNDADSYAHFFRWKDYLKTLDSYDLMLVNLLNILDSLPQYKGKTTVLITADHGRGGRTFNWSDHGHLPGDGSKDVFLFAFGPHIRRQGLIRQGCKSQLALRPTIEALLGTIEPSEAVQKPLLPEILGF